MLLIALTAAAAFMLTATAAAKPNGSTVLKNHSVPDKPPVFMTWYSTVSSTLVQKGVSQLLSHHA